MIMIMMTLIMMTMIMMIIRFSCFQLQEIIVSHEETFFGILQASTSCKSMESLRELSDVTSVVCCLKPRYEDPESITDDSKRARGFLSKLQRILLGLMQSFSSKELCDQVRFPGFVFQAFEISFLPVAT